MIFVSIIIFNKIFIKIFWVSKFKIFFIKVPINTKNLHLLIIISNKQILMPEKKLIVVTGSDRGLG